MNLYLKRKITIILISIISSLNLALMMSEIKIASAESAITEDTEIQIDRLEKQALEKQLQLQHQEALQIYEKLLAIYRENGDKRGEGNILDKIANIYIQRYEKEKALKVLQQSINIYKQTDNRAQEAKSLILKAKIYKDLSYKYSKKYFLALTTIRKALTISREIGNSSMEAESLFMMAEIYYYEEKSSLALKIYEKVLAIYKKIDDSNAVISI